MNLINLLSLLCHEMCPMPEKGNVGDSQICVIVVLSVVSLAFIVFILSLLIAAFRFGKSKDDKQVIFEFLCDEFDAIIKNGMKGVRKYEASDGTKIYICNVKEEQGTQDENEKNNK